MGSNQQALAFWTEDSTRAERMRITHDGNVGIGTTSPVYQLAVNNASGNGTIFSVGSNQGQIGTYDTQSGHVGSYLYSASGYSGIATVDNAGTFSGTPINWTTTSVGIGTTTVSSKLFVGGGGSIGLDIGANDGIFQTALTNHANGNVGSIGLGISDGGGQTGVFVNNRDDGTYNSQDITFLTAEGGVSAATERLRITKAGNVGIGTTSPQTLLYVNGTGTFRDSSTSGNHLITFNNGAAYYQQGNAAGT